MNIQIYFEFTETQRERLALQINGDVIGLEKATYDGKSLFSCEMYNYNEKQVILDLTSLTDWTELWVYFQNKDTGLVFKEKISLNKGRRETKIVVDLKLLEGASSHNSNLIGKNQRINRSTPTYRKSSRQSEKSIIKTNKDRPIQEKDPLPNYKYYENQTKREELLTAKADEAQNTIVEVFYATDRKQKKQKKGRITYTNTRGDLELGSCIVSVPANKAKGAIPLPEWYLFGLYSNENKHMQIKTVNQLDAELFFNSIKNKVQSSPERDAFVFVHGYNVDFTDSVMRAAQIAADIGFRGAPIIYSWPSRKKFTFYHADEATTTGYSIDNMIQLLKDVKTNTGAERVHLIAHSMGNRLLTDALKSLVDQGFNKDFLFNQIILAAPDIDAEVFVKNIAPKIIHASERVTLYTSQHDKPLWFSEKIHGGIQRAGTSSTALAIIDGMDTVDASIEKTDFMGHGYFAESKALIDDIFHLVRYNREPIERNLRRKVSGEKIYWEFY